MKNHIQVLVLLGTLTFCICHVTILNTDEFEAKKFIQNANERLHAIHEVDRRIAYEFETLSEFGFAENYYYTFRYTVNNSSNLSHDAKNFDTSKFKNEELKYIIEILKRIAREKILGLQKYRKIVMTLDFIQKMGTEDNIPKYKNKEEKVAYFPEIEAILAQSNDTREIEYYWNEWRRRNPEIYLWRFLMVMNGVFDAAKETGISAQEFYMQEFNITELERIMNETQPLYNQLHAFVRYQLNKKYGNDIVSPNGVIPDHLFRQVIAQTWTNTSVIEALFPLNKLPNLNKLLQDKHYQATDLYKMADQFYKSLGFDSLPENKWDKDIKMSQKPDQGDCKPKYFDTTPNVLLFFCQKMDFRTFLQAHGYMGQIYYAREKVGLPSYYSAAHNLEASVGEAVILSASTLGHLKSMNLLDNYEITEEAELNRLIRMGLHTLITLRQQFIHSKIMVDLFAGKYNKEFLNIQYWKLMEQYLGVGPPSDRSEINIDPPYEFYIEVNENGEGRKLYAQILGYQFYKKFCEISGKYSEGKLHTCDIYGSKKVGEVLKKMMKLGSSKPLTNVLESVFPENPKMTSDALLEFYSPMQAWLSQKNLETHSSTGWTSSAKTVKEIDFDE